jgi:hypothetical protein
MLALMPNRSAIATRVPSQSNIIAAASDSIQVRASHIFRMFFGESGKTRSDSILDHQQSLTFYEIIIFLLDKPKMSN